MCAGDQAWRAGLLQLPVPALTEGSQDRMAVHLLCSRPGAVTIEARLGSDTEASQRSPPRATADGASEVRHLSSVVQVHIVCNFPIFLCWKHPCRGFSASPAGFALTEQQTGCCKKMEPLPAPEAYASQRRATCTITESPSKVWWESLNPMPKGTETGNVQFHM